MSGLKSKKSRKQRSTSPLTPSLYVLESLYDCHQFLSPNEHSDTTLGLLASILRPSMGETFLWDVMNDVEKMKSPPEAVADCFLKFLEEKRNNLPEIDASIEKCMALTRMMKYIQENKKAFNALIANNRLWITKKMTNDNVGLSIPFLEAIRKRISAQEKRRLFYLSDTDAHEPKDLIYLQNRITTHLNNLFHGTTKFDLKTLEIILNNSFLITIHPHCNEIPVTVYKPKTPREYTIRLTVRVVSLLHDFMQTHPNVIELSSIEPSLLPKSEHYRLEPFQNLVWNICELRNCPGTISRRIQYAESSTFTIQVTAGPNACVHLNAQLHQLALAIKIHINIPTHKISKTHPVTLESLPFGIVSYNGQIPHTLARVILHDIRRFAQCSHECAQVVSNYVLRYFVHRTGVTLTGCLKTYVEDELNRARYEREKFTTLEDVFMDFLVPFVDQVEFLVKHPLLSMLIADGLCQGICDSTKVPQMMKRLCTVDNPIVNLRLNTIRIDYQSIATKLVTGRAIKLNPCAVRVDICQDENIEVQKYTFDSKRLMANISSFITTSHTESADHVRVLSTWEEQPMRPTYKSFGSFDKYYDPHIHSLHEPEPYRPIINIIYHIRNPNNNNIDENPNPAVQATGNTSANLQSVPVLDRETLIQWVLADRDLSVEISRRLNIASTSVLLDELDNMDIAQYLPESLEQNPMDVNQSSSFNDLYTASLPANQTSNDRASDDSLNFV